MQQITQYAAAVATSAAAATATGQPVPPQPTPPGYSTANSSATTTGPNTPTTTPTAPPAPPHTGPQPQARVVFTRPSFPPNIPSSAFGTRGTTINVRATMPGQQPGQVRILFDWFMFFYLSLLNCKSFSTGIQPCCSQSDDQWIGWTAFASRTNG